MSVWRARREVGEFGVLDRSEKSASRTVVVANSDLIDKLGVAVLPSIPFEISMVGSLGRCFRFLPEPCGAAARDPGSPPPTRRSAALRQTTETDSGRSILVGLAVRG